MATQSSKEGGLINFIPWWVGRLVGRSPWNSTPTLFNLDTVDFSSEKMWKKLALPGWGWRLVTVPSSPRSPDPPDSAAPDKGSPNWRWDPGAEGHDQSISPYGKEGNWWHGNLRGRNHNFCWKFSTQKNRSMDSKKRRSYKHMLTFVFTKHHPNQTNPNQPANQSSPSHLARGFARVADAILQAQMVAYHSPRLMPGFWEEKMLPPSHLDLGFSGHHQKKAN